MAVEAATQVTMDDVTNERELYAWLASQPAGLSRAIAARAALRSLPAVMNQVERTAGNVNAGASLVACLRATLMTCVAARSGDTPDDALKEAANAAIRSAPRMYPSVTDRTATLAGMSAAETVLSKSRASVADAASQALQLASDTARSSTLSAGLNPFSSEATMLKDAEIALEDDLLSARLWSTGKAPLPMLEFWEGFVKAARNDAIWAYWVEWYQGFMAGRPVDWEFQNAVALIDDSIWRQGAQAVAVEIERLRAEIAAAQAARAAAEAEANAAKAEAEAAAAKARAEAAAKMQAAMPKSVDHLLNNRVLATAVLEGAAAALGSAGGAAPNGHVGIQVAMRDLPQSLTQIAGQLRALPAASVQDGEKNTLKSEVAKFNIAFDVLESTVSKVSAKTCTPQDRAVVAPFLAKADVLGNLVGGLLILAGPDEALVERYEGFTQVWNNAKIAA